MEYYEYRVVRSSTDTDKAYFLKLDLDQQLLIIKSGDSSIEDKEDAFERLKGCTSSMNTIPRKSR